MYNDPPWDFVGVLPFFLKCLFLVKPCQKPNGVCSDLFFFCKFNFFSNTVFILLSINYVNIHSEQNKLLIQQNQCKYGSGPLLLLTLLKLEGTLEQMKWFLFVHISVFILNAAALWLLVDFCLLIVLLRIASRAFVELLTDV